jgi:V8-like Glu-specific endopeptidase
MASNRISPFFIAVLALLATNAAPACASTSVRVPRADLRRAQAFWTAARMKRAVPLEANGRPPELGQRGRPGRFVADSAHRYAARASGAVAQASSASEVIPDPTLPAYSQNGVVFIVIGHGGLGRCSATSVNAPNLSVVFTAGHCVHQGSRWFDRKWVFVPGYHYGIRPFGVFAAKWLGSTSGWVSSENENFDVGAAVVSPNERGQKLAATVGAAGIAWNLSPRQLFDVYGYPVEEPFDGATLRLCPQTAFEGHDITSFLSPGPLDLAVQCNVTGGASGGGWLIAGDTLNGVTSSGYSDDPTTDFGPYFGSAVGRLFREAAAIK